MRKFSTAVFFLFIIFAAGIILQKRYNFISILETSTVESQKKSEDYIGMLRKGMMERQNDITVSFVGKSDEVKKYSVDAISKVFEIDGKETSSDYDYLRYHYAGTSITMTGFGRSFQVNYKIDYLESKKQMEEVDKEVKRLIKDMNLEKKSDFKKVKKIHDYIIRNVQYDVSTKNNSAYAALIKKSSACQGYATLVYKMMTEAKIPCRIIAGRSSGEAHAWNIVKVNKKWYNLDCTWDDPVGEPDPSTVHYEFFLKSDGDFKDHQRDEEYDSKEFRLQYPIALKSYGN